MTNGSVWKFQVPIEDSFMIEMPIGAELLFVAAQNELGCLWARVNTTARTENRKFKLRGTGHPVDLDCKHIGSFILRNGRLVFHLFEDA